MEAAARNGAGRVAVRRAVVAALVGAVACGGFTMVDPAVTPQAPAQAAPTVVDVGTHGGIQLVGRNGRKIRKLWGRGHGVFKERGRRSAATITG